MKLIMKRYRDRPYERRLALVLCCMLASAYVAPTTPSAMAQDPKMVLRLGPMILAEANRETLLPVAVEPADAAPPKSFLRIRGLPPTVALSDGHALGPGLWAVPLRAVPDLRIIVPAGITQRSEVLFSLVSLDGTILAEASTQLVVAPTAKLTDQIPAQPPANESPARAGVARGMTGLGGPPPVLVPPAPAAPAPIAATPPAAVPPPPVATAPIPIPTPAPIPAPAPTVTPAPQSRLPGVAALAPPVAQPPPTLIPSVTPEERQRLQRLIDRGDEQLAEGSVAAARLLYTRAAEAGHAQGALSLGATYDPNELARLKVVGIRPDIEVARAWYRKAQALGALQAADRLRRLESR